MFEGAKNSILLLQLNAHAGIGDLENKTAVLVGGTNGDAALRPGKLHRIVDQVPENLLEPDGVGPDMMAVGAKVHHQVQLFFDNIIARDLEAVS